MIVAERVVPVAPGAVFAFLADLGNHWQIADGMVEVISIDGPRSSTVRLTGPLGVHRTARTSVEDAIPPGAQGGPSAAGAGALVGIAEVGSRTRAEVRWRLQPEGGGTRVRLSADVVRATVLDRVLLALGGGAWLRRRFSEALESLERHVSDPTQAPLPPVG